MNPSNDFAYSPSTIKLGDLEVNRLGFGAMRLPGKDVWGEAENPAQAKEVLKKAIDLGINLIDTAWYYGPYISNKYIKEALYPYPSQLVIACKLGAKRLPDKSWVPFTRPEDLKAGCEDDLRTLKLDRIDVVHLRTMENSDVPFLETLDAMIQLQKEGKIRHIGLSNTSLEKLELALTKTPIVSVQNMYNISKGGGFLAQVTHSNFDAADAVLELCTKKGIAFMPFFPFGAGSLLKDDSPLNQFAKNHKITPAQAGIAWLLAKSPAMLPIPGTGSVAHLIENWEARKLRLNEEEMEMMEKGE
jgi:pyridoxine 4-dehydrogenase